MKNIDEKKRLIEKSYYGFISEHALSRGDDVYLFTEKRSYTWREAKATIEALAYRFCAHGVGKGALVALRATRCLDIALLMPALTLAGAVAVMTDAHCGVREFIAASGADIAPDFFVTNEAAGGGIDAAGNWTIEPQAGDPIPLDFGVPEGHTSAAAEKMDAENAVTDPSLIIFTSGSTGKSKAVMLCQRNYIANSVDGGDMFEEGPRDVSMLVLPLHHIFGLALIVCATVNGHSVFFPSSAEPDYALKCVGEYGVTVIYSVPTYFLGLIADGRQAAYDLSSLRFGLIAGGPSTSAQMRRIEQALGCRIVPVYGMSEYVGITSCPFAASEEERCAGVGWFYPLNEGFILDDNGVPVARGEVGEICVRGYDLMLGYYNDEAATNAAVDAEGRLHTGDLGYEDENGVVHISGRKKDIIIRGGENLSASKIENALLSCADVCQAAVVGVADPYFGEVPAALVVPESARALTAERLQAELSGRLSKHEIPARIVVTDAFPLTSTGKVDKIAIKKLLHGN